MMPTVNASVATIRIANICADLNFSPTRGSGLLGSASMKVATIILSAGFEYI